MGLCGQVSLQVGSDGVVEESADEWKGKKRCAQ